MNKQKQKIISMLRSQDKSMQETGLLLAESQDIDLSDFWRPINVMYKFVEHIIHGWDVDMPTLLDFANRQTLIFGIL